MNEKVKLTLLDYYKWIISLSTFIITSSIAIFSIDNRTYGFKYLLVIGIFLLGNSIFFNFINIKRLVTALIVEEFDELTKLGKLHQDTMSNIKIYGLIQNISFIVGSISVTIFFLINML